MVYYRPDRHIWNLMSRCLQTPLQSPTIPLPSGPGVGLASPVFSDPTFFSGWFHKGVFSQKTIFTPAYNPHRSLWFPPAKDIWRAVGIHHPHNASEIHLWIDTLRHLPDKHSFGFPWSIVSLFTCLHIWNNRNKALFVPNTNSSANQPCQVTKLILGKSIELFFVVHNQHLKRKDTMLVGWSPHLGAFISSTRMARLMA